MCGKVVDGLDLCVYVDFFVEDVYVFGVVYDVVC